MNETSERKSRTNDVTITPSLFGQGLEDNVVGTWFARIGVLALLIGAAFGYRYAVDQGLIGPAARVALGVLSGSTLLIWGHWSRSRGWFNFAHALSGGGLAILYLSVLAAQYRFDLITPAMALTFLTGIALLSAWLALQYDSLPLAVLATLGAFANPVFLAADDPTAAMGYVVGVDLAVVGISFIKRWSSLNRLALVGSVIIFASVAPDQSAVEGLGFATVLWVLFCAIPFLQVLQHDQKVNVVDVGLEVTVGFLYLATGIYFLEPSGAVAQGVFALVTGLGYGAWAAASFTDARTRQGLAAVMGALGVGYVTLAPPLMVDGPTVPLMWGVEGAILFCVGGLLKDRWAHLAAAGLITAGLIGTVDAIATYSPDRLLFSPTSMVILLQICVLYVSAVVASRVADDEEWRGPVLFGLLVAASLMTLGWLSQEIRSEVERSVGPFKVYETTQLALSALWGSYAAVLLAVGIRFRQPWARYLGLAVFAVTVVKMVTIDLWQLEMLHRTIAFVGLGILMIACSFLYNRFRELIVGSAA